MDAKSEWLTPHEFECFFNFLLSNVIRNDIFDIEEYKKESKEYPKNVSSKQNCKYRKPNATEGRY